MTNLIQLNTGVVDSIRRLDTQEAVYDFEVADNHNFYIRRKGSKEATLVHNCHYVPALQTSRILAQFSAERIYGLSGTVERKVSEEINIAHDLIGPVVHTTEVESLRAQLTTFFPRIKLTDPKGGSQYAYTYFMQHLESSTPRREKIVKEIIRYARMGHLVLVPLRHVAAILRWTQEINYETETPGFALPFYGGLKKDKRREFLQAAKDYKCRVLVGNIALLSTGLNIPRASCIFEVGATSNIPKAHQRMSRILTPLDDKPTPTIVYVLDDSEAIRKCRRNEFWNCVKPRFDPIISKNDYAALMGYLSDPTGGVGNSRSRYRQPLDHAGM